jgi:hypothetical protein
MNANRLISNKERKLLLIIAFAAFIFSIAGSVIYSVKADIKRSEYYSEQEENKAQNKPIFSGPYCFPDKHPQLLRSIVLLAGVTFFSLCFAKRYLLSSLITTASLSVFVYWFIDTRKLLSDNESPVVKGLDRIFYRAGDIDLIVFLLVSILLFWQISILLRMLIKTLQRKTELP